MSRGSQTVPGNSDSNSDVPVEHIVALEEFVEKLGGIERAKLAIETLDQLREAA